MKLSVPKGESAGGGPGSQASGKVAWRDPYTEVTGLKLPPLTDCRRRGQVEACFTDFLSLSFFLPLVGQQIRSPYHVDLSVLNQTGMQAIES